MFLLQQTEDTVTEICLDVGFVALGTFSRTFRDIVGASPTTYRRRSDGRASTSFAPMFNSITHHSIFVLDQDEALDFLRDPFGNHIRIAQPAPQPLQVPTPAAQA